MELMHSSKGIPFLQFDNGSRIAFSDHTKSSTGYRWLICSLDNGRERFSFTSDVKLTRWTKKAKNALGESFNDLKAYLNEIRTGDEIPFNKITNLKIDEPRPMSKVEEEPVEEEPIAEEMIFCRIEGKMIDIDDCMNHSSCKEDCDEFLG